MDPGRPGGLGPAADVGWLIEEELVGVPEPGLGDCVSVEVVVTELEIVPSP